MHKPEFAQENETYNILWNLKLQTDPQKTKLSVYW